MLIAVKSRVLEETPAAGSREMLFLLVHPLGRSLLRFPMR